MVFYVASRRKKKSRILEGQEVGEGWQKTTEEFDSVLHHGNCALTRDLAANLKLPIGVSCTLSSINVTIALLGRRH